MGRSQKRPDLRSPISKIRDMSFVGTGDLIIFRKFHNFPWNIVAVARLESYFVIGSLDLTWWPDLTWHWVEIFTKVAEKMGGKVGENPAALRAAVFSLSSKNLRGGGAFKRPPPAGRGLSCSCKRGQWQADNAPPAVPLHHIPAAVAAARRRGGYSHSDRGRRGCSRPVCATLRQLWWVGRRRFSRCCYSDIVLMPFEVMYTVPIFNGLWYSWTWIIPRSVPTIIIIVGVGEGEMPR